MRPRTIARGLHAMIAAALFPATVASQTDGEVPAHVPPEYVVTMRVEDGSVACGPSTTLLSGRTLHLRVDNRSDAALWFVAPQFFAATRHLESTGFTLDLVQGGFAVAPRASATVVLRTPEPGRYYFSCFPPGIVPNPASSGIIAVVEGR